MINLNQEVTIKWFTRNKQRYISLGYEFTQLFEYFRVKVKDLEKNSNVKVEISCDACGAKIVTPYRNYNKIVDSRGEYRCRKCNAPFVSQIRINNNKERLSSDFEKMIENLGYKVSEEEYNYNGCDTPLPFVCPIHGRQELSINQLRQGCVCPECGKINKSKYHLLDSKRVQEYINSKNHDVLLNPKDYTGVSVKNLQIKCGSCGKIFTTSLASIKAGGGRCDYCAKQTVYLALKKTKEDLIKETTKNGVCYLLNPDDYINSNFKNLKFKCADCGAIFIRSLSKYKLDGNKCFKCRKTMSKGEEAIANYLESRYIKYETQKRFPDCKYKKTLPFDFYLQDFNCCIEFDGAQHYKPSKYDRSSDNLLLRKERDRIKDEYCKKEGMALIRIPYWEYRNIPKILKENIVL